MSIRALSVSNYKSFDRLDADLRGFNILIGANASGKSNFISAIKFLRDITRHGLDNAISMQGGMDYLRNISIGSDRDVEFEIKIGTPTTLFPVSQEITFWAEDVTYAFSLSSANRRPYFRIERDEVSFDGVWVARPPQNNSPPENLGAGRIKVFARRKQLQTEVVVPEGVELPPKEDIFSLSVLGSPSIKVDRLLLEYPYVFSFPGWRESIGNAAIYDFDPKLPKRAVPVSGKADLEEDGSNLALVLRDVLRSRILQRRFSNLISDLLPFVSRIRVEDFADKSLLFTARETYFDKQFIPASVLSDGTINVTALVVALFFQDLGSQSEDDPQPITVVEEPERNIHPKLISKVVSLMREAAASRQIIASTHNPELVKWAGLENLLLMTRDREGFSRLSRPSESHHVKKFLENDMGLDELYVQNLLQVGT